MVPVAEFGSETVCIHFSAKTGVRNPVGFNPTMMEPIRSNYINVS